MEEQANTVPASEIKSREKPKQKRKRIMYEELEGITAIMDKGKYFAKVKNGETFDCYAIPLKVFDKIMENKTLNEIRSWWKNEQTC